MRKYKNLVDEYAYPGFRPLSRVVKHPDKSDALIITLRRRQKKQYVEYAEQSIIHFMIENFGLLEISLAETPKFILK